MRGELIFVGTELLLGQIINTNAAYLGENLASLGGAGAVLSSTFLRIFEEFSYRRLGISCRLSNGVCEMDGVAPAEGGYYIVEGGGLPPRIDVRGFNRRVDWEMLLSRLQLIVTSDGPVIR